MELGRLFKVVLDRGSGRNFKSATHWLWDAPEKEIVPLAKWLSLLLLQFANFVNVPEVSDSVQEELS